MAFDKRFLDELRDRLRLSEVIGRTLKLTRAGAEFKACCPFHKEKTPSFYINDAKGFYHCFGCGAHGDVIGYRMQHDNLSFVEAIETLAGEAGLPVPQPSREAREEARQVRDLQEAVHLAADWFAAHLDRPTGDAAKRYLHGRGITAESIARFHLGYAPADRGLLVAHLADQGVSAAQMVEAGLANRSDRDGSLYSFFRDRVMFPITDRRGRIIAFGGRVLPGAPSDAPKYLNSSDTPLFHKKRLLYGLAQARGSVREGHRPVVVEGYTDVIALAQAGFGAALAPLGTAFTEEQAREVWALVRPGDPPPVLCFDGDAAGRRAAGRALDRLLPALGPDRQVAFAFLPQGQDPDSLVRAGGAAAFAQALEGALTPVEVLWRQATAEGLPTSPEGRAALEQQLMGQADQITDGATKSWYRKDLRDRLFAAFRRPHQAGRRALAGRPVLTPSPPSAPPVPPRSDQQVRVVMAAVVNHPRLLDHLGEDLGQLRPKDPDLKACLTALVQAPPEAETTQALCAHLSRQGLEPEAFLTEKTYLHGAFARPGASEAEALAGVVTTLAGLGGQEVSEDLRARLNHFLSAPDQGGFEQVCAAIRARVSSRPTVAVEEAKVDGGDTGAFIAELEAWLAQRT